MYRRSSERGIRSDPGVWRMEEIHKELFIYKGKVDGGKNAVQTLENGENKKVRKRRLMGGNVPPEKRQLKDRRSPLEKKELSGK